MNTTTIDRVKVKVGEGADAVFHEKEYTKVIYETVDDVLAELTPTADGKENPLFKTLLANINMAVDSKLRGKVRQEIIEGVAGPDKAFNKAVADIMKARAAVNKPLTLEKAKLLVKAMMEAED